MFQLKTLLVLEIRIKQEKMADEILIIKPKKIDCKSTNS